MGEENTETTQLDKLKIRIPYKAKKYASQENYEAILQGYLDDAESIALETLYPFLDDYEDVELPKKYFNWQIRAAVEISKWQGNQGVKSYSETGLSWSKDNDGVLSTALLDELIPRVGTPKRRDVDDN